MTRPDNRKLTAEQKSEIGRRAGRAASRVRNLTHDDYARMGRKGAASKHAKDRAAKAAALRADEPRRNAQGAARFLIAQLTKRPAYPIEEHTAG